jgi:hypothetical protein
MSRENNQATLNDNPSLKEINWYKKQISWGDIPPFYHMIASSISEGEGILYHGFDNAVKHLVDKTNWNLELLKGMEQESGEILCQHKPQIALHQTFTKRGFELWAFPYAKGKKIDSYVKDNRYVEFKVWNPQTMKVLLRFNQLHEFINFYFSQGDLADKALILYAHKVVHQIINFLKKELNVLEVDGVSIKDFYQLCEKDDRICSDELDLAKLTLNNE